MITEFVRLPMAVMTACRVVFVMLPMKVFNELIEVSIAFNPALVKVPWKVYKLEILVPCVPMVVSRAALKLVTKYDMFVTCVEFQFVAK